MISDFISSLVSHADFPTTVIFLVVCYIAWKFYDEYNLPPGPRGLPIVGYLPFMGSKPPEETFKKLGQKYGDVMSLYFGSQLMIIINSYEMIKEAYIKQGENFAARPHTPLLKIEDDDSGIFVTDGQAWSDHRRFILSTLRDYGMGKMSIEPKIQEEIHFFLDELAGQRGKPINITSLLGMSTANIISTLEFGKRFDYSDGRFQRLRKLQDESLELFGNTNPRPFFPWLDHLPFADKFTHTKRLRQMDKNLKLFMQDMIDEHRRAYSDNSRKDLIDAFLTEQNTTIKKTKSEGNFNENEMEGTLLGLFGAGTETTTATLRWAVLLLLLHPEVQKKVQKEIDDVVGMERDPTMSDKTKMVYTEAVLLETQRFASLLPINAPHSNFQETQLRGYRIPKRAIIMTNLWAVHFDPELWNQPEKFNPERFINPEGKIEKPEYLIPFGIGKRACVGESLARMELFLYFTSLYQRFTITPPKGVTPKLDVESTFFRRPKAFEISAFQRPEYSVGAK